jgi:GT2 family glycosyltransferase
VLNNPSVAIVILNYNGRHYLQQFLPSVLASTYLNKRIIVADNASTDDSIDFIKQNFTTVETILLDKNYGFTEGYNKALQQVQADYFILLNSDVEVTQGWIEPIVSWMENDTTIGAAQPKILSYHNRNLFEYAGASGGWIDKLGYPLTRGRVLDICEEDHGQYNQPQKIFWATGAAMFVRASAYNKAGGLYGYLFAHMEEIDLCWRLQRLGYSIVCCPASVVYHVGGGTLPKTNPRKVFLNFRNNSIMLYRNLCWHEKIWKMPLRFFLSILFSLKRLLEGDAASCKAVLQAQLAIVAWWFVKKENIHTHKKSIVKFDGVFNGCIVWSYFIKKKKRFSEIVDNNL